ncbi:MAG: 30S ribosomal protein S9 [Candidatus Marinimicrobia bacterium]|jgi:small subunit ribosomal protein S9|nr:30S ribosomal protein S9 [Candidatus Neomarinimicrobiota bacterium]MBP9005954.1 30S ribosomal protein S9 [Candidatus Neomarinimicrobiota bacterium]HOD37882.1 30S ribosomal protein S9 [Candidatus Neomarinimicrobiota bacterium]HQQ85672.1 30S ribosomal protein S9 [Candidatus Neomarinimicrobiota bacterium]
MPKLEYVSLGRRKSSIARLRMQTGEGKVIINSHPLDEYFGRESLKRMIIQPFEVCGLTGQFDVNVKVEGGGYTGQAGAIRLAIARALEQYDPELRAKLKPAGFLTRDSRVKERKKYGLRGARRAFQFSKR